MKLDSQGHPDICRETFSPVSDDVRILVSQFKLTTNALCFSLNQIRKSQADPDTLRLLALAVTHYELASMWAVKALTTENLQLQLWSSEPTDDQATGQSSPPATPSS